MSIRRNVIANYLGQGWAAVMGLAFVPIYVSYLGMEAYGLVGLFALLQGWLALLDMGMTPTLGREMARFTAREHSPQSIRDLLRSLEIICFALACVICLLVWAGAGWLASEWLRAEKLSPAAVRTAILVMALVVAFRFVESIYRSALIGLQRQVRYNIANATLATVRSVGAIAVLAFVSPTITAFFLWQAFVSLFSIVVFAHAVHRSLPRAPVRARFSSAALLGIWRFATGMTGITFLAIALTQIDKLLLSRLLSLEAFGYYTLAAAVTSAIYIVVTPITTAVFPRMVELIARADRVSLAHTYHRAAQVVTLLTAPAALLLAIFGENVLLAWSGDADLARKAGPLVSLLAIGSFLNGLMYVPYQLQLAHGWTGLTVKVNLTAVLILVPALFWAVGAHGALGAAWIWTILNAGYVLFAIQLMHLRLMPEEKWDWYLRDVTWPTLAAAATLLLFRVFRPLGMVDRLGWFAFLAAALATATAVAALTSDEVRARVFVSLRRSLSA